MYGDNITYTQALIVCVFSLIVVFVVLQAITYMIQVVAWFIKRSENKGDVTAAPEVLPEEAPALVPAPAPVTADSHIDVVLITAAVAAYLGTDSSSFVVRSIRRIGTEETAWSRAGRLDSLQ